MSTDVLIPEIGESISSGIIAAWLKEDSEAVEEGEDLFELETDKATLAVPSPATGILSVTVEEGQEVHVGQTVAVIAESGDAVPRVDTNRDTASNESVSEKKVSKDKVSFEINIDEKIEASSGKDLPGNDSLEIISSEKSATAPGISDNNVEAAPLSPAVRLLVEQHALNPANIKGSGKGGRITKKDVLAVLEQQETQPPPVKATSQAVKQSQVEGQHRVEMTGIRKRIAENLLNAKQNAAHVTTFNEIDMSRVMQLRKTYKESFEKRHGVRLGFMSFFVKACCNALNTYPAINAYIDGKDIVYNNRYNIGIAVSTERGLIVPVIRDADSLGFADIEKAIRSYAQKARDKKITIDELTGGTFTITNGGVFGSMLSTPIPSPPQSAILGMHSIKERPVAVDGEIVIHPVMYVALTYDHRLIDGSEAVSFLVLVKEEIEDPERMLIDI
jgi:2-oxoglutarate dehydrogenase E2 component (dihydrolipoamide succinyltransferase)